jgi:threonine aldolase
MIKRRDFIKLGGLLASGAFYSHGLSSAAHARADLPDTPRRVNFVYDGSNLTAAEYTDLLMKMADEGKIKEDYYSNGGIVEELENKFANWLGKERAVFMPTGTLANHIAIRTLAGDNCRVIVQEQSHIYNDSGDCVQILSHLNMIPLAKDRVGFSSEEVAEVIQKTDSGRVAMRVGVISIESPVRRQDDRMFNFDEMQKISEMAVSRGIKTHMDGARLFVESVHSGKHPAEYGILFDTVYTSLYKCFNAASGAILAGPKKLMDPLFHTRRMFGGGMPAVWPFAAVALHFVDGFITEYQKALQGARSFFTLLCKDERFRINGFTDGTHIFKLLVSGGNLNVFKNNLAKQNIQLGKPYTQGFVLKINPSLNRQTPENLAKIFSDALDEA